MLASPYLDLDPVAVARFLAQSRKSSRLQVDTDDLRNWLQRSNELPRLRVALESLPKSSAFSTEHSVAYWADLTRKLLETFGWPGRAPLNSDEYQCSETWKDLLVSISSLELFAWKSDFTQFVNRLQSAASTQRFKSESHNVPIQIMDAAEAEGSTFDALWVASCCDDLWPDTPRHSPLIPGALLREAGVPILGTPDAELRISHITARLLQSAPQVFLSMARRSDDEREQRWSPCFLSYPLAPEAIAKPLLLAESFRSEDIEILSDSSAPAVQPNEIARGGTWLLQDQSNCPFRAFAIRRLLARESEGPNEAIAPTERGNVVDRALQLIWEELKGSEGLRTSDVAAVIEAATDKAMSLELPPTTDPWTLRFRALERQRTIEVLTNWITLESTREPFHVLGHQLPVELNLSGLTLRGYVDRLDEVEDAHIIIDYKTGAKNVINAWQVPRPRMPQLPFYALAMKQQKLDVAGISFAIVRKDNCEFRSYLRHSDVLPGHDSAKRTFEGVSIDDYTAKWATELEELAASFLKGNAAVDPKVPQGRNGSPCEHCHLTPLCRIGDLAGDDFESIEESYE